MTSPAQALIDLTPEAPRFDYGLPPCPDCGKYALTDLESQYPHIAPSANGALYCAECDRVVMRRGVRESYRSAE